MPSPMLSRFPDGWDRAVAVVAHPDDLEYGAASAIAQWTTAGKDIRYVLMTSGEAGIATIEPKHCGPMRELEQKASAAVVGVTDVEFMGFPDGLLESGIALRRALAGVIRRHRPDMVISINHRNSWEDQSWNHVDHRTLGVSLLDAVRDAANPWIFTDQGEAWEGTRFCAFNESPNPTHFEELSPAALKLGIESLKCHDAYLSSLDGEMADASSYLTDAAMRIGELAGVELATSFELI